MYRTRDLVDLALKGIPEKYRVEIWMVYTGTWVVCMFLHCNIVIGTVIMEQSYFLILYHLL